MKNPMARVLLFSVFYFTSCALFADTVTVPASADTWILGEDGFKDNNMGGGSDFAAGVNAHLSAMRALLKFDLSSIPANATVTSVTLGLTATRGSTSATTFVLHRLLVDWGEGNGGIASGSGDLAVAGEATWNNRQDSIAAWAAAGAAAPNDFSSTVSGSVSVTGLGSYSIGTTAGMIADVQGWVNNSSSNFGWIFKQQTEGLVQTARRWAASEGGSGPSLVVDFTAPASAQSPTIAQVTRTNNQLRFSFNAEANRTYAVETRNTLDTNSWSTLTNYSAASVATNLVVTDSIPATNKFYRIRTP